MDYGKMWNELKWKLIRSQGMILKKNLDERNFSLKKQREFMMRVVSRVLELMEELEKGEENNERKSEK